MWMRVLVWLALVWQLAAAHTIDLMPSSEQCFFEDMHVGDEMTLTYQVTGGGHLDIDTRIRDPSGRLLFEQLHKDTGTYDFIAEMDGRYKYCFSNEFSALTDKSLSFNVHGVLYLTDEEGLIPAERELRELATNVQMFKDEQQYFVMRERIHRNSTYLPFLPCSIGEHQRTYQVVVHCANRRGGTHLCLPSSLPETVCQLHIYLRLGNSKCDEVFKL